MINLVVSDEQVNTSALTDLWVKFKKDLLSDERLRTECTTFLLTYNNTVSDAVRRQDTDSDILWGQGHIFEELHFKNKIVEENDENTQKIFTIEEGIAKEIISTDKTKNFDTMSL